MEHSYNCNVLHDVCGTMKTEMETICFLALRQYSQQKTKQSSLLSENNKDLMFLYRFMTTCGCFPFPFNVTVWPTVHTDEQCSML